MTKTQTIIVHCFTLQDVPLAWAACLIEIAETLLLPQALHPTSSKGLSQNVSILNQLDSNH